MTFSYNAPITFGRNGTAREFNPIGIDFTENTPQSWTIAPTAELEIAFPFSRADITMELVAEPFLVPGAIVMQQLFLFVGGSFTGFVNLHGHATRSFALGRNAISGRTMKISLVIPTAVSPASLGLSNDERQLGLALSSLTFRSVG
jgi:hypothetical protein